MTFFQILDSLLLQPLQLLFEVVYVNANRVIGNPGLSIIVLSLVMNFLVLPLYMRADALQEEERDMEARLHRGVTHIKKTFRGDEKMMILQTYYRQNHYKPTYVLRSAVSLFLEIPFFIAAYRFLSGLELIKGVSFGPIADLGAADVPPGSGSREPGKSRRPFLSSPRSGCYGDVPTDMWHTARHIASAARSGRDDIFPQSRPPLSAGEVSVQVLLLDTLRINRAWGQHIWEAPIPGSPQARETGCPQSVRCPDQRIQRRPPRFPERSQPRLPQQ